MFSMYPDYPGAEAGMYPTTAEPIGEFNSFFGDIQQQQAQPDKTSTLFGDNTAKAVDPFDNTDESMMWYGMPSSAPTVDEYLI